MSATWLTRCAQRATNSTIAAFASSFWHEGNPGCFSMSTAPTCFDATFRNLRLQTSSHRRDTISAPRGLHRASAQAHLQDRPASTLSGSCAFPHEIGLFLGYPFEDVMGFIENKGENYLCSGCWKVYSCEQDARVLLQIQGMHAPTKSSSTRECHLNALPSSTTPSLLTRHILRPAKARRAMCTREEPACTSPGAE